MVVQKSFNKIKGVQPLKEIKKTKQEVQEKMITLILVGFELVAALAWNDAIRPRSMFSS